MNITQAYTSTVGRIGRGQFILWGILLSIVLGIIVSIFNRFGIVGVILGAIVNILVMFYCRRALVIKRAHDMNNEGTARWNKLFITNCIIIIVGAISGFVLLSHMPNPNDTKVKLETLQQEMTTADATRQQEIQKEMLDTAMGSISTTASPVIIALNGISLIAAIYALYLGWNLVFKKGTSGDNTYGKDPLASK